MVSIIIPCKTVDKRTQRCIDKCNQLFWPQSKEILVVTDKECPGFPAQKRNWALDRAVGQYIAFIDSDAYPSADWLWNAMQYLQKKSFIGVCGPGILPADASFLEQAADLVYKMMPYNYRVIPKKARLVAEFPTFNLIVKKNDVRFKNFLTGEDSLYCRELPGRIVYDPEVVVYHSRRPLFLPFWQQVATYGLHRGHLIMLALVGWLGTLIVYPFNFIKGFFRRHL